VVSLQSQADVDNYAVTFPGCTTPANLYIDGSGITNLLGLSSITSVSGNLIISASNLTSLDGLNNLSSVGDLNMQNNASLVNFDGLSNLSSVNDDVKIIRNASLINIDGLSNLSSANRIIISLNASLISIEGLNGLSSLGTLIIVRHTQLSNCSIQGICDLLSSGTSFNIVNVVPGGACNSIEDLAAGCVVEEDLDSDGFSVEEGDCDDTDNTIFPGAAEVCDGVDNNCDGQIDEGADDDCDGVSNLCDICPGGDDSIDNNNDGIADCSQLLSYNEYSSAWKCGNNKINICHNGKTLCISKNALPAHFNNHGDFVGPCTSCSGSNAVGHLTGRIQQSNFEGIHSPLEIFPNPASNILNIHGHDLGSKAVITIYDNLGRKIWQQNMDDREGFIQVDLTNPIFHTGMYMVSMNTENSKVVKRLVISK